MKKMIFITFLCFVVTIKTSAQINTHFFEKNNLFEMAPNVKKTDFESIPTKRMPPVDLEKLLQEDREKR